MEASDAAFRSEAETDRSVLADFTDGTPKGKEFFSRYEDASLLKEVLRERRPAKHRRNNNARFFQPHTQTARNAKMFDHCPTPLSQKPCRWRREHELRLGLSETIRPAKHAKINAEDAKQTGSMMLGIRGKTSKQERSMTPASRFLERKAPTH